MVIEQELKALFQSLLNNKFSHIVVGGSEILVGVVDEGAKLALTTPVYCGGNYIPTSVRKSAEKTPPFSSTIIKTDLVISEQKFEVLLTYLGSTDNLDINKLKNILEEFAWCADEWRQLLDEQDRNDRVRVPH